MPHVNINIYLSSIVFFDKPISFCETEWCNWRSNKINTELLGNSSLCYTLLPTKKYRDGTQILLHEQFSTATAREPVMDLPRTADSVIHCTWQPQNPSERNSTPSCM